MNEFLMMAILAVAGYLVGSISMTRLVTRIAAPDVDLDHIEIKVEGVGSYHFDDIGATTASLKLGPRLGGLIGVLDILKAFIPVLALRLIYPEHYYHLVAAVSILSGHIWPLYHRFAGGTGISPTYGGFLAVDWLGTLISAVAGLIFGFAVLRDIMIAYLSGPWLMLLWLIFVRRDPPHILYGVTTLIVLHIMFIPRIMKYFKLKNQVKLDRSAIMDVIPMGRMMKKLMRWLRLLPREERKP